MARIGYARVSTHEQNVELQRDTLREKGCTKVFTDKITGTTFERKELNAALAFFVNLSNFMITKQTSALTLQVSTPAIATGPWKSPKCKLIP